MVTRQCYRAVLVFVAPQGKYSGTMTTSRSFPGPRDGLDEGSLAELVRDSREVQSSTVGMDVTQARQPRTWGVSTNGQVDVPDDASSLIDGLAAYGS
jgi:hypothetical protein